MNMDVSGLFPNNWIQKSTTTKKVSLKFKSIHIYKQLEDSHINQGIHHLQYIYHERLQIGRKNPLLCQTTLATFCSITRESRSSCLTGFFIHFYKTIRNASGDIGNYCLDHKDCLSNVVWIEQLKIWAHALLLQEPLHKMGVTFREWRQKRA